MIRRLGALALTLLLAACGSSEPDLTRYAHDGRDTATRLATEVTQGWNANALVAAADPRMLASTPEANIRQAMTLAATKLGTVSHLEPVGMDSQMEPGANGANEAVALYHYDVTAEHARVRLTLKMQKVGSAWKLLGFWMARPKPAPAAAGSH